MQFINLTAAVLIRVYQQYLSPHKGFVCAYHVLYPDRHSCSEAIRLSVISDGLFKAWGKGKQQFADCAVASKILAQKRKNNSNEVVKEVVCCLGETAVCAACDPLIEDACSDGCGLFF